MKSVYLCFFQKPHLTRTPHKEDKKGKRPCGLPPLVEAKGMEYDRLENYLGEDDDADFIYIQVCVLQKGQAFVCQVLCIANSHRDTRLH